jgi:hypothetical protein
MYVVVVRRENRAAKMKDDIDVQAVVASQSVLFDHHLMQAIDRLVEVSVLRRDPSDGESSRQGLWSMVAHLRSRLER